jgi:hypothetical protein
MYHFYFPITHYIYLGLLPTMLTMGDICILYTHIMKRFIYLIISKILRLIDNKPKTGRDYY